MSPAALGLKPGRDAVPAAPADGRAVFETRSGQAFLQWTPDAAQRAALAEARSIRIEVDLTALEGTLSGASVQADWGGGYSEESYARLKPGGEGLFAALPARGRRLLGVRLTLSEGAGRFAVSAFSVMGAGKLDADPRGALGPLVETAKAVLGPLRAPVAALYRRSKSARGGARPGRVSGGGEAWREAYIHAFNVAQNTRSVDYAGPMLDAVRVPPDTPRVLAFYLPQFHPFPENDAWWGKGFTEWTNVSKAQPQFLGHYQPRLPGDLGYYDLRLPEVMAQQVTMARNAGIAGFCFHYYWFDGKRLLERPLDAYLADPSLDLPFALCWANENWTRRWDGDETNVLIGQNHSPEDDIAVFRDMARYMADPRYVRVGGKPILVVYRPELLPDSKATTQRWRTLARELGLGELALYCTTAFGFEDYQSHGFDGLIDFPPHGIDKGQITRQVTPLHGSFQGEVYDYKVVAADKLAALKTADPNFVPTVMPGWDNQARKPGGGKVFHGADPATYRQWLSGALAHVAATKPADEALVFVNAWNEWGEGAYLEPDRWFGHAYLHATAAALGAYGPRLSADHPLVREAAAGFARKSDAAVLLHLYYPELVDWFAERLKPVEGRMDTVLTVPETWAEADLARVRAAFPKALILVVENRGRDIRPFVEALRTAGSLGYSVFCKLHTKRSPHRGDGDQWRAELVDGLVGADASDLALKAFAEDPKLGLLAASGSRMQLGEADVMANNGDHVQRLAALIGAKPRPETPFAAGSMFWGRTEAFAPLIDLSDDAIDFETESGRVDGTTAHAIERLTAAIVVRAGYRASFEL